MGKKFPSIFSIGFKLLRIWDLKLEPPSHLPGDIFNGKVDCKKDLKRLGKKSVLSDEREIWMSLNLFSLHFAHNHSLLHLLSFLLFCSDEPFLLFFFFFMFPQMTFILLYFNLYLYWITCVGFSFSVYSLLGLFLSRCIVSIYVFLFSFLLSLCVIHLRAHPKLMYIKQCVSSSMQISWCK
jgi:hypothetical protein